MSDKKDVIINSEAMAQRLCALYQQQGYSQYKMSKFESYDFYVRNKDFLVSDRIITFTDMDGRLMALKPDITLSIAKGYPDSGDMQKLYYNERVYRVASTANGFQEIMQTGLECLGNIDTLSICEVIALAADSLASISDDYLLEVSHMGIIMGLLDELHLDYSQKEELLALICQKNGGAVAELCAGYALPQELSDAILRLIALYGDIDSVYAELEQMAINDKMQAAVHDLHAICQCLHTLGYGEHIRIDFSLINDMRYYTGVLFQGFVNGVPTEVLSGGQYDKLMQKMGKHYGAIGFAVYHNVLERFYMAEGGYDVDTILLYEEKDDVADVLSVLRQLKSTGISVSALPAVTPKLKYRRLLQLRGKEACDYETND